MHHRTRQPVPQRRRRRPAARPSRFHETWQQSVTAVTAAAVTAFTVAITNVLLHVLRIR
ncbi:hypothetical protein [Streptacidiphilus sp. EB103A]|uniref:hypothetical protein n=1 Tax=Streptacidiphilus sp. EB103A TaxID=3156275 RepID=UPI003512105E